MTKFLAVLLAGVFSLGTAFANEEVEQVTYDNFEFASYDIDDDGFLDEDEVSEIDYVESNFDTWDVDDDGLLSDLELEDGWVEDDVGEEGLFDI